MDNDHYIPRNLDIKRSNILDTNTNVNREILLLRYTK